MDKQNVTDTQNEVVDEANQVADQAAAEEATAEEAKEPKEGEKQEESEKAPEVADAKHNRENAEFRTKQNRRIRDLEIENARLKGFQEGIQRTGGKTEGSAGTANDVDALYQRENPKPDPTQFETNAEFFEALTDWKIGLRDFKQEHATKSAQTEKLQTEIVAKVEAQRTKGEEKYPDFHEVVANVPFTPDMEAVKQIFLSPIGEDISMYLGTHPEIAEKIAGLSDTLQAKEIGRIEAGLESGKLQVRKTTTAPPPPATIGGKGNAVKKNIFDENMSTADRIAHWNAQKRAAAGQR